MLLATFDQRIVMQFHTFLMSEFHNPKVMAGKDATIRIELTAGGLAYHRDNQSVHLSVTTEAAIDAFTLGLYTDGTLVKAFHFSEILFYEARNVFLNWMLYERICYKQAELKWKKHVTQLFDDKPYKEVDIAVHINSRLETMTLYNEFKAAGWTYLQDAGGYLHTIGHHDDNPICVSPLVHTINGVKVMYVEATSAVVDWGMVDKWINERCNNVCIEEDPCNLMSQINRIRRIKTTE